MAIAVGIVTITALGAFLAAGGRDAKSGLTPGGAPEGSAEVDRVTARGPSADRGGPASDIPPTGGDRGAPGADDQGHMGISHDSNGGGDSGHQSSGGGGGGGGGGEPSTPLATVKVPGVGTVTVDEPAVPRLPHVEETVPDLPAPDLPLPQREEAGPKARLIRERSGRMNRSGTRSFSRRRDPCSKEPPQPENLREFADAFPLR